MRRPSLPLALLLALGLGGLAILAVLEGGREGGRALEREIGVRDAALEDPRLVTGGASGDVPTAAERTAVGDDRTETAPDSGTAAARHGDATPARITGVVVDEAGAPLEGVEVRLEADTRSTYRNWSGDEPPAAVRERVRTDEGGRFVLAPGGLLLSAVVAAPEGLPTVRREGCRPGDDLRLVATRGAAVAGLVSEVGTRAPVEGAEVRVFHGRDGDERTTVLTDAAGRYSATGLGPGDGGVLVVPPRHVAASWRDVALAAGETARVDVDVEPGGLLTGRVTDAATGAPVAGAEVSTWDFLGRIEHTDEQGRFAVPGVAPRPGTLSVRADGYGRGEARFESPVEELEVALAPGLAVVGRLVEPGGAPGAGQRVILAALRHDGRLARREWRAGRTDDEGRFRFEHVRTDLNLYVQPRAGGFGATTHPVDLTSAIDGVVDLGDLPLRPGAVLGGTVVDASGAPVAEATLMLLLDSELASDETVGYFLLQRSDTTGADGGFLVPGLAPGTWGVRAHVTGGRTVETIVDLAEGERCLDLRLELPGGTPLRGRVVDLEGRGIGGANVVLFRTDGGWMPPLSGDANEAGEFEIQDVPEGTFAARVVATSPDLDYLPVVRYDVVADGSLVEFTLRPLDARINGRVVDARGAGVPDVCVSTVFSDPPLPWDPVLTDAEGRFALAVTGASEVELAAWRTVPLDDERTPTGTEWQLGRDVLDEDGPALRVTVEAGEGEVVLRLR